MLYLLDRVPASPGDQGRGNPRKVHLRGLRSRWRVTWRRLPRFPTARHLGRMNWGC